MNGKQTLVSKNVRRIDDECWRYFIRISKKEPTITGKYLFFSESKEELEKIAIEELENGEFFYAKINTDKYKKGKEFVLCLYYSDDSKRSELAEKYKVNQKVKYRYWKSDEDTLKGKYSEEFLDNLPPKERKEWTITMKKLYPSFANPETWRNNINEKISEKEWNKLRLNILKRDNHICQYCEFKAEKWQIVHHIDGNPNNNKETNLETICPMCNLIHHAGQGCVVQGIVDLYKKSKYSQNKIIQITRQMRSQGKSDKEIITFLGLEYIVHFKMDKNYLKKLMGFVTSRKTNQDWTQKALEFGYRAIRNKKERSTTLLSFQNLIGLHIP